MYNWDYRDPKELYDEITELGTYGLALKEIGDYYCLHPEDWQEFCDEHPLVEMYYKCGVARGIALAGTHLIRQIKAGKIQALTFYLKTLGGFTEKSVMELQETLKVASMTMPTVPSDPTEAAKVYQRFMKDS